MQIEEGSAPGREPKRRLGPGRFGRPFLNLWASFALASSGDGFAYGAVPLLALVVDPRPVAVASVIAADGLPWLLMALPAGAFADRFERGRVMATANLVRAAAFLTLAVLVATHDIDLGLLIGGVLLNSATRAVFYSALQASVPELVDVSELDRANGFLTGTEAGSEHLAGPVAGAATFVVSRAFPFVVNTVMFTLSGLWLRRVRTPRSAPAAARGSMWDGARYLFGDRRLRILLGLIAMLAGLQGLVSGVLVLVATRDWGVHASAYGLFVASGAVGNLPGAFLAGRIVGRLGSAFTLLAAAIVAGGGYLLMAASHGWLLAGGAFALSGFAVGTGTVASNSLRQRLAPPEIMGRVGAAWRGIAWGAAPVGAFAAGGVAVLGGLRLPLIVAGCAQCAIACALAPALLRRLGRSIGRVGLDDVVPEP
ncbi:MAG: MFS transporter [Acidimicrobiales bacterium]|jgi:MFS family permease